VCFAYGLFTSNGVSCSGKERHVTLQATIPRGTRLFRNYRKFSDRFFECHSLRKAIHATIVVGPKQHKDGFILALSDETFAGSYQNIETQSRIGEPKHEGPRKLSSENRELMNVLHQPIKLFLKASKASTKRLAGR
jgi:hypothetical protein